MQPWCQQFAIQRSIKISDGYAFMRGFPRRAWLTHRYAVRRFSAAAEFIAFGSALSKNSRVWMPLKISDTLPPKKEAGKTGPG
jgi:hypothetical protein